MLDKRLGHEAWKVKGYLVAAVVLGFGIALLAVSQAWLVAQAITAVFWGKALLTDLKGTLALILVLIVARSLLLYFNEICIKEAASRVKEDLRERLLVRLLDRGPLYARGERAGELVNTVVEGVESLEEYFSRYLPQLALAVLIPVLILCFVAPTDFQSAIILLLTGPLIPFFMILIGRLAEKKSRSQWQSLSRMSAHFLDMLQGLATLKVFGRSLDQIRVIARVSESFRESTMGVLRIAFLSALVLEFLATISTAMVAAALGLRLVNGTINYTDSLFLLMLAPDFYAPLRALGTSFHARLAGVNAAERIYELIEAEGTSKDTGIDFVVDAEKSSRKSVLEEAGSNRAGSGGPVISFENVSLSYDPDGNKVLNDITFTAEPGQHIALVGASGEGKTSMFQVLLRFAEPSAGTVKIGEIPLCTIPKEIWWQYLAYVPQKPYLFAGTVLENLRLGRDKATLEEVIAVAELAEAHEFIKSLPQGYDTRIGEGGARLSGGEGQRLALARAFLKDAPILLFDEAMSGLDKVTEQRVLETIRRQYQEKTVISISHRLETLERADCILLIEKGRLVAQGKHQALQQSNAYVRLLRELRGEEL